MTGRATTSTGTRRTPWPGSSDADVIGKVPKDARLGRPSVLSAEIVARIVEAHLAGAGWSVIARQLNAEGVSTAQGGAQWHPSTVRAVALAR